MDSVALRVKTVKPTSAPTNGCYLLVSISVALVGELRRSVDSAPDIGLVPPVIIQNGLEDWFRS